MRSLIKKFNERTYYRRVIFWCNYMYIKKLFKNGLRHKTILFYPDLPRAWNILYPICHVLGYKMTNNPKEHFDIAIAFESVTTRRESKTLDELVQAHPVLNARCGDISKKNVARVFEKSFGYGLAVDPRTYKGLYVKKPDENAAHFGMVLDHPMDPEPGFAYEKLIDSRTDENSVYDIRTFIFGDFIPFTFYRKRDIKDRFGDDTIVATRVEPDTAFSKEEQVAIFRFCKDFGLDYGELDIVRDRNDGRIYVVDVNNAPSGPRSGLHVTKENYAVFLAEMAGSFEKMVRTHIAANSNHTPSV